MFKLQQHQLRYAIRILAVGLTYFITARLGLSLASVNEHASPVWPATGFAILALCFLDKKLWPGIAMAALAANHFATGPSIANIVIATGNTFEAVLGASILRYFIDNRMRIAFQFETIATTTTAVISAFVSATLGNLALITANTITWQGYGKSWLTWWLGDTLGALCLVPLALSIGTAHYKGDSIRHALIGGGRITFLLCIAAIGALVFFATGPGPWIFALLPLLIIAALGFGAVTTNLSTLIISAIGLMATVYGHGPFTRGGLNDNLIHLQLFLGSFVLAGTMIPGLVNTSGRRFLPICLLVISWIFAAILFQTFQLDEKEKDRRRFISLVDNAEKNILTRLAAYEDALRAGASLFAASDHVSHQEWKIFIDELQVNTRYPGINGIGAIFPVLPSALAAFEAEHAKELPVFTIHAVPGHDMLRNDPNRQHFITTYIEPLTGNQGTLGLDVGSEANRRMAAELSRDTGMPAATRRITLVQDYKKGAGFLLYLPFYKKSPKELNTIHERRQNFQGWIYAPFISEAFFDGILGSDGAEFELDIYEPGGAQYIYRSQGAEASNTKHYEHESSIPFAQQTLQLSWRRTAAFDSAHDTVGAWAAFCTVILGLLLTTVIITMRDVSVRATILAEERTREIQRLEKANRTYTELVQGIRDYGIIIIDPDGTFSSWNDGARFITGHPAEDIIGRSAALLFPPSNNTLSPVFDHIETVKIYGHLEIDALLQRKDGTLFLAHILYSRIDDEAGNIKGYSKVFSDITEAREREKTQRDALTSLRLAVAASKLGFFYIDIENNHVEYSQELQDIIGISFAEDRQKDRELFFSVISPQFQEKARKNIAEYYAGKTLEMDFEYSMNSPEHGFMWIRLFMHSTHRDENNCPSKIIAFMQDISAQKAVSERVRESERRLAYALEGSNDGLWDWDLATGEFYVSERLAERFGGPSIVFIENLDVMLKAIHPDDRDIVRTSITEHLQGLRAMHECESRLRLANGDWGWFLTRGKISECNQQGQPIRMTGVHIDIAAIKYAEAEARMARAELELSKEKIVLQNVELVEATAAKSSFLATMSHEIRTPLNGVIGMADLLSETNLDQNQLQLLRIVQQSGSALLALINDILDYSKIDANKLQLENIPFDIVTSVESQVDLLFVQANKKGICLQSIIDPRVANWRIGDPGRISQILLNLIGNAIKFTASGSVVVTVSSGDMINSNLSVRFEVRDTGIGIKPEQASELFQPFKQADSSTSRQFGGTGLGLSICKGLTDAMGGQIGARPADNQGSVFWFEVPLPLAESVEISRDFSNYFDASTGVVVLISREETIAIAVSRYIEGWGMKVYTYTSLDEFRDTIAIDAEHYKPTIVIVDTNEIPADITAADTLKSYVNRPTSIVINLVAKMVSSREWSDFGAQSTLFLPLSQSSLFDAIVSAANRKGSEGREASHKLSSSAAVDISFKNSKILVAEDNATNQILVKKILESLGYSCHVVANGLETIEALERVNYDLILMDCQMPEMDGYEATRRIRATSGPASRVPIIAVTANALSGDERLCREAGMNDYLTKPLKKKALEAMVKRWLSQSSQESNHTSSKAS